MNNIYKEFVFKLNKPAVFRDIFIAKLAVEGFEGFVETENGFIAYTDRDLNPEEILSTIEAEYNYTVKEIYPENWNKKWEEQIKPIEIEDFIYIKTSFHQEKDLPLVITIDPKMSFGTGHHETTYLMIQQMMDLSFKNKTILDMGSGTGVLAILASYFGAKDIYAVDNDHWAYENMLENFKKNHVEKINAYFGDASLLKDFPEFDIILANINRNILLNDMKQYISKLKSGGNLILSGFYQEDIPLLLDETQKNGMIFENQKIKNNWVSLRLKKI